MVSTRQSSTPARRSRKKSTTSLADTPASNGSARTSDSVTSSPATPTPSSRKRTTSKPRKSQLSNDTTEAVSSKASDSPATTPAKKTVTRRTSSRSLKKMQNPKTTEYEFAGPIGAAGISFATPFFAYALYFFCNEKVGCSALPRYPDVIFKQMLTGVKDSFFDAHAWGLYLAWYAFTVACWAALPGKWEKGTELRNGKRLEYKTNGFLTLLASVAVAVAFIALKGARAYGELVYDHWPGLVTASIVMALGQAIYVYVESFKANKMLAKGGNSGNHLFDWFIGRELNPRIGRFDIKTFNELRPGMILWLLLDLACACHQFTVLRGRVTDSMVLAVGFHSWYIVDALFNESAIYTQMDITTDGFGFMLAVGDLTWVPFVYSLQARYLAFMPKDLGIVLCAGILALQGVGYYIFRTANAEKNEFRKGHNPKKLQSMTTSSGRKLLTSGWWGLSRHPNYFGDWIMALTWSLPTGFSTPIPYFYIVYFIVLLVHRQRRDDAACAEKYGKDWTKYCKLVPSRIIPYVY